MEIPYEEFSVLGAIVGSYLFGIGIILAGGCATGTWYRAGEGLLGSWVALFFYMTSAAAMKSGFLVPLNQSIAKRWVINDDLAESIRNSGLVSSCFLSSYNKFCCHSRVT